MDRGRGRGCERVRDGGKEGETEEERAGGNVREKVGERGRKCEIIQSWFYCIYTHCN